MKILTKKQRLVIIVSFIIALFLLISCLYNLLQTQYYYKNGIKTDAVVDNILTYPSSNDECQECYEIEKRAYEELLKKYRDEGVITSNSNVAIIVKYEFNNQTYFHELGYFSEKIDYNDHLNIYIINSDPYNFITEIKKQTIIYIGLVLSIVLFAFNSFYILVNYNNKKYNLLLKTKGNIIKAKVLYIDENEKKSLFDTHPVILTCSIIDDVTNSEKIFISDSFYPKDNPLTYIDQLVDVYVLNDKYYVDIEKYQKN